MFTLCVQGVPKIDTQFELQFFNERLLIIYFGMFTRYFETSIAMNKGYNWLLRLIYISNREKQWFLMFQNIVYCVNSIDKRHFVRH